MSGTANDARQNSTGMPIRNSQDIRDPGPQVVRRGHLHSFMVTCYLSGDESVDDVSQAIAEDMDVPDVEVLAVEHVKDHGVEGYTLWEAMGERPGEPNSRFGNTVHLRPGEPLRHTYTPPAGGAASSQSNPSS